ncbi:MAG TPA: type II toxin-antitoxin system HicB family antitoxin [Rhizomicrobium sp.]|jgi:predicted RNase H-like HicB family nuclease|nr:type II toxin-antitoxin system HicB family antitoxin [Rhizomicrobium sp.]
MASRLYPAILERAEKKTFAVWLPDFPDCVAAGRTQEEALEKAQGALAETLAAFAEQERALPEPTALAKIEKPKNFLAFVMVTAAPPDPSERVNVYLPKSLIGRADQRAAEMGMSRSSFFGLAISVALAGAVGPGVQQAWGRAVKAGLLPAMGKKGR